MLRRCGYYMFISCFTVFVNLMGFTLERKWFILPNEKKSTYHMLLNVLIMHGYTRAIHEIVLTMSFNQTG